ncbi:MAG: hypothetical protein CVT48_03355 [Thermoplasmata archaeon HGW-Thermoplasmata-1]|nr:MAG: hypothetical protein CVT48_03355 [Thermoplasmata archaeon HGW-Thermoplasmata-1]
MELDIVDIRKPEDVNFILGQAHFIKSVEDIYEAVVNSVPQAKFGVAFCEASGPCLIRLEGNDEEMISLARENMSRVACGHSFGIFMRDCYPINLLSAVKAVPEVANVFCASSNPVKVVVAESGFDGGEAGRGIMGVIDGFKPKGVEDDADAKKRTEFLRMIGYKR